MIKETLGFCFSMLFCIITINAQQADLPKTFIGYGWLVAFPYDIAFIPSEQIDYSPTVKDFFKQKKKYGVRLNGEDSVTAALDYTQHYPIKYHDGDTNYIQVVPVMAYYKLDYIFSKSNAVLNIEPYSEMLQLYSYQDKVDSVFYRFGMDYDFHFRIIQN